MQALFLNEFGDANVLQYGDFPIPVLKSGHALVRNKAIGLNFADIYRRKGTYHIKGSAPFVLGFEGAGTIVDMDASMDNVDLACTFKIGDRVGYADIPFANAEYVLCPLTHLIPLPDNISFEIAAASLLQGLTAHYLINDSYQVKAKDNVVVHAAAGGVGLLLVQMCKMKGAHVIGLVSSQAKANACKAIANADQVLLYDDNNTWVQSLNLTYKSTVFNLAGVDATFDSVGSTLDQSINCTRIGGTVVFYGMANGDPKHVDPRVLMDRSTHLVGGDLWNVLLNHKERVRRATELFEWIAANKVTVTIAKTFKLEQGQQAHEMLQGRSCIGKIVLLVE